MISNVQQLRDFGEIFFILEEFNEKYGNWEVENINGQCIFYCEVYHPETMHLDTKIDEFCKAKRAQNSEALNPYIDYILGNDGRIYIDLNKMSRTAYLQILDISFYEACDEIFEDNEAVEDRTNEDYGRAISTTNIKFIREFCEYVLKDA